jgi:hypothetical protein
MKPLCILIADDHEVVRQGIRALLEARPECQNEGFDENLADFCAAVQCIGPEAARQKRVANKGISGLPLERRSAFSSSFHALDNEGMAE